MATKSRSLNELMKAIEKRRWKDVSEMCKAQPDLINKFDEDGENPLIEAVERGAPEEILLQIIEQANKKTLNTRDDLGRTILHWLASRGYTSALARALEISNDNINAQSYWPGYTPLYWLLRDSELTYEKHKEMTKILLDSGAITTIKNKFGKTPIDYYKDNECRNYDENKREANKAELLLLLQGLIPEEILARGTKAIQSYMDEVNNGKTTMVNSRIMVLGKEGTGKTSTINTILGKELNKDETSTDGIVTTTVVQNVGKDCRKWEKYDVDVCELTKEIYDYAIAENVAKTLNTNEKKQSDISEEFASLEASTNHASSSTAHRGQIPSTASEASSVKNQEKAVNSKEKVCELTSDIDNNVTTENVPRKLTTNEKQENTSEKSTSLVVTANQASSITQRMQISTMVPAASSKRKQKKAYCSRKKKRGNSVSLTTEVTETVVTKKIPDNVKQKLVNILVSGLTKDRPKDITSIWDYAGQQIYYIGHRFYLTSKCVYCVVFSLADKLDDMAKARHGLPVSLEVTNLEMIVFFVRSIYEHTVLKHGSEKRRMRKGKISFPPILLVGTHKDKLKGSEADKLKEIEEIFSIVIDEIKKMPGKIHEHVDREIYAVDNNNPSDEGIQKLMKNSGDFMNQLVQTVPISWVNFQGKLQEAARTRLRMSLVDVTNLATECGIFAERLTVVLDYLTDVGVILYSKKNEKLKYTVIINLHEMIDMMKTIITAVEHNPGPALEVVWERLDNKGILEEELLRHLWEDKIKEDASNLDVFLEVLKIFGLLVEKGNEQGKRIFLVPCRMKITTKSLEIKKDDRHTASIYVTPTDFLPDAVYSVLVVGLLQLMEKKGRKMESKHVKLFQNRSDFDLYEDHHVRLGAVKILNKRALKLEISHMPTFDEHGKEENFEPQYGICIEVLKYVRGQLETVYGTMEGVGYELCVFCDACNPVDEHLHKLDQCLQNNFIRCGNKAVSTTRFKRLFAGHEEGQSKATKFRVKPDISQENFQKMLIQVSTWYDDNCADIVHTLIVLYKDMVTQVSDLESAETMMDLFWLLQNAGHLNPKNYDILIDTANLTGTQGVLSCNELLCNACRTSDETVFTSYRQKLVGFGNKLSKDQIKKLADVKRVPLKERHNQWTVILNLEKRGEISKNNMQTFIQLLKDIGLGEAAKELEETDNKPSLTVASKVGKAEEGTTSKLVATTSAVQTAEVVQGATTVAAKAAVEATKTVVAAAVKLVAATEVVAEKAVKGAAVTECVEIADLADEIHRAAKQAEVAVETTAEKVAELEQQFSALKHLVARSELKRK